MHLVQASEAKVVEHMILICFDHLTPCEEKEENPSQLWSPTQNHRGHFQIAPVRLDQLDEFCQVLQGQIDLEHGPLLVGALLSLERPGT